MRNLLKAFTVVAGLLGPSVVSAEALRDPAGDAQTDISATVGAQQTPAAQDPCTAYADCRALTAGEKKLAKSYFGDTLPYDSIRIVNGRYLGLFPIGERFTGIAPDGNIYVTASRVQSADYSREPEKSLFFIHEMSHVAQHYAGMNLLQQAFALHSFAKGDPYKYVLEPERPLADYNVEQQARMVEMLHAFTQHLNSRGRIHADTLGRISPDILCRAWNQHHEKLSGVLIPQKLPELCR